MECIVNWVRKLLYITHINPKIIVDRTKPQIIEINSEVCSSAYKRLETVSPNPKSSCVAKNAIAKQVDVHFIVPAYNAEQYIKRCVDSIVVPKKNISYHLTIVNDGSTDKTQTILNEYMNVPEVEIITQSNRGFSGARNAGLKNIKGKYICFVDSDDYILWNGVEAMFLLAEASKADMVIGNHYVVNQDDKVIRKVRNTADNYNGYPWGKLFKAECFEAVCFPEKFWFEDSVIKQIVSEKFNLVKECSEFVYYYRENPNGITQTSRQKPKTVDSLHITLALHEDRLQMGLSNTNKYYDYILLMSYLTFVRAQTLGDDVLKDIFIVFTDFICRTFGDDYTAIEPKLQPLGIYIRNKNYGHWKKYCKLLKI